MMIIFVNYSTLTVNDVFTCRTIKIFQSYETQKLRLRTNGGLDQQYFHVPCPTNKIIISRAMESKEK